MAQQYFKILRPDMTSVGLFGATPMQYNFDVWNRPRESISNHPRKGGGLWVAPSRTVALALRRYVFHQRDIEVRIFKCVIGEILYRTNGRVKTDKLFFIQSDEVFNLPPMQK